MRPGPKSWGRKNSGKGHEDQPGPPWKRVPLLRGGKNKRGEIEGVDYREGKGVSKNRRCDPSVKESENGTP